MIRAIARCYLIALTLCIGMPASVEAGGCGNSYYSSSYCAPTYYPQRYIETVYVAQFLSIPLYSVGLPYAVPTPPPAVPVAAAAPSVVPASQATYPAVKAGPDINARLDKLEAAMVTLVAIVQKQQGVPTPIAPTQSPPPDQPPVTVGATEVHKTVFTTKCVVCHDAAVAEKKGGGMVLVNNGQLVPLTPTQQMKVVQQIWSRQMPPDKPLSDQEVTGVLDTYASAAVRKAPVPEQPRK